MEPAPVVSIHQASPRQQTPQPSRKQDFGKELAEATAKIDNLGALLPAALEPEAMEEPEILRGSSVPLFS